MASNLESSSDQVLTTHLRKWAKKSSDQNVRDFSLSLWHSTNQPTHWTCTTGTWFCHPAQIWTGLCHLEYLGKTNNKMTDDFWLDESITSYSEAINYLGLFHLYQEDNRAATERQKPAAIALHHRPPRRQHWRQLILNCQKIFLNNLFKNKHLKSFEG